MKGARLYHCGTITSVHSGPTTTLRKFSHACEDCSEVFSVLCIFEKVYETKLAASLLRTSSWLCFPEKVNRISPSVLKGP